MMFCNEYAVGAIVSAKLHAIVLRSFLKQVQNFFLSRGIAFTMLHFLHNLQMGPITYSVSLQWKGMFKLHFECTYRICLCKHLAL